MTSHSENNNVMGSSSIDKLLPIINNKKNLGKGFALKKGVLASKNDWVLFLDADERLSNSLVEEINSVNLKNRNIVAYKIFRKFLFKKKFHIYR